MLVLLNVLFFVGYRLIVFYWGLIDDNGDCLVIVVNFFVLFFVFIYLYLWWGLKGLDNWRLILYC